MKIKLLDYGIMPKKGREGDAAWDIFLPRDLEIQPHSTAVIDLGICLEIPKGYAGMLVIRSSISKKDLLVQPPLIDSNYRGECHGIIHNLSDNTFYAHANERLFSLLIFPIFDEELVLADELSESNRGNAWSGSSGK